MYVCAITLLSLHLNKMNSAAVLLLIELAAIMLLYLLVTAAATMWEKSLGQPFWPRVYIRPFFVACIILVLAKSVIFSLI